VMTAIAAICTTARPNRRAMKLSIVHPFRITPAGFPPAGV
jgi:hypothetical protein